MNSSKILTTSEMTKSISVFSVAPDGVIELYYLKVESHKNKDTQVKNTLTNRQKAIKTSDRHGRKQ